MVLKEFIYNVIIQPLHLLLYVIFIGNASNLASTNILYTILCFVMFFSMEPFIREMFGIRPRMSTPLKDMTKMKVFQMAAKGAKKAVSKTAKTIKEGTKDRVTTWKDKTKEQMDLNRNADGTFDKGKRTQALKTGAREAFRANVGKHSRVIKSARGVAGFFGGGTTGDRIFGTDEKSRSNAAQQLKKQGRGTTTKDISKYIEEEQALRRTGEFKDDELNDIHEQYSALTNSGLTETEAIERLKYAKYPFRGYSKKDFNDSKKVKQAYDNVYTKAKNEGKTNSQAHKIAKNAILDAGAMHGNKNPALQELGSRDYMANATQSDKQGIINTGRTHSNEDIENMLELEYDYINDDKNKEKSKIRLQAQGKNATDENIQKDLQKEFRYKNNVDVRNKAKDAGIDDNKLDSVLSEQYDYLQKRGAPININTNSVDTNSDDTKEIEAEFLFSKTNKKARETTRTLLQLEGKDDSDKSVEEKMQKIAEKSIKLDDPTNGKKVDQNDFEKSLKLDAIRDLKNTNSNLTATKAKTKIDFVLDEGKNSTDPLSRTKVAARMAEVKGKQPTQKELTVEMGNLFDLKEEKIDKSVVENYIKTKVHKNSSAPVSSKEIDKVILDTSVYFDTSRANKTKATEIALEIKGIENEVASYRGKSEAVKVAKVTNNMVKSNRKKTKGQVNKRKPMQKDLYKKELKSALGGRYSENEANKYSEIGYQLSEKYAPKSINIKNPKLTKPNLK